MLLGLFLLGMGLPTTPAAAQAIIIVNSTSDLEEGGDGLCILREAIANANTNTDTTAGDCTAGIGTTDQIRFDIGGGGTVETIRPTSALPPITEGVIIDGITQGCPNGPCIELDGSLAGAGVDGLVIRADNCTVQGLVINRFRIGLSIEDGSGNVIQGNYIGTDINGTVDRGNFSDGVLLTNGASGNTLFGNHLSGNGQHGVLIEDGSNDNVIENNFIGVNVSGTGALRNDEGGVSIVGSIGNVIGGTTEDAGNLISGNNIGVDISNSDDNRVEGNYIGTNVNGTGDLGNTNEGVRIINGASDNVIGGTTAGAGNVISGNNGDGVQISNSTNNFVQGNYIGTNAAGTVDLGNSLSGVTLNSADNNTIGGTTAGARNVISGNNEHGISIIDGFDNFVQGNYIGTEANGTDDLGNSDYGVYLAGSTTANVTQREAADPPLLSASTIDGAKTSSDNAIGGTVTGAGNIIAFNGAAGVALDPGAGTGNPILRNNIFENGGLGIDLDRDGPTPNDINDDDGGPNTRQNFALLTDVAPNGTQFTISGTLNSTPNTSFRIEFFSNNAPDNSGFGEGETFLGFTVITTDAGGNVSFEVDSPTGTFITTTVTDPEDNTSEFSPILQQDFGDAPVGYPTRLSQDGARHIIPYDGATLYLGTTPPDPDNDGQPSATANGDDTDGIDDEDGVEFPATLVVGQQATVAVTASAAGRLDAWIDFNDDGDWSDTGEKIINDVLLNQGESLHLFTVPATARGDALVARFRLSSQGELLPTGPADDGEVEDYQVPLSRLDYGDAPAPYPTLLSQNGARHLIPPGGATLYLGTVPPDPDNDGQPTATANGDDTGGIDDEDGVEFLTDLVPGQVATVAVTTSAPGRLDAWVDADNDGVWEANEKIIDNVLLGRGTFPRSFILPAMIQAEVLFARFRYSSQGGLLPTGQADDGEVEDYRIELSRLDYGDAPADYPTRLSQDGARHIIPPGGATLYLGTVPPDPDNDGQPTATANGDDDDGIDDEDGVEFPATLVVGQQATVEVTTSATGRLDAWIDFNDDDDWNDSGEKIIDNVLQTQGTFSHSFSVPATAQGGALIARFRYSRQGGLLPTGQADDGEVEDYQVAVLAEADIELTKRVSSDVVDVGTDATFTLVVINQGPSPATGVMVTDRLPDCLAFVGASSSQGSYSDGTGNWNVGTLSEGQSATLDIMATVTEACPDEVTNTAEVTASDVMDPDSVPGDGQGDDFDGVMFMARNLMISVSPDPVNFDPTDECAASSKVVMVENTGNADVQIMGVSIEGTDNAFFGILSGGGARLLSVLGSYAIILEFAPRRPGAHTATLVVASNDRGGNKQVLLSGDGVALVLQAPQVNTPQAGQEVRVRVVSPGTFNPTTALLFYRRGGETMFIEVPLQAANGALEGIIPPAFVTVRGVEYYVLLGNACATLTFPAGAPDAPPVHLPVEVLQLDAEGTFPRRQYLMVSIPVNLDDRGIEGIFADNYGAYDDNRWRVLRWRPSAPPLDSGQYDEFPVFSQVERPHVAFWLITSEGLGFDVGSGTSVDASEAYSFQLEPGWNQIGSPFAFPVSWDRILAASGVTGQNVQNVQNPVARVVDGEATRYAYNCQVLDPWQGYFVLNEGTEAITLMVPPEEAAVPASNCPGLLSSSYMLQLVAEAPALGLRDTETYLGLAKAGSATSDVVEAPAIDDHLNLSIVEEGKRFAGRLKHDTGDGQQWDLELGIFSEAARRFKTKTVTISLVEHGQRPEGFDLYVFDRDLGRLIAIEGATFTLELTPEHPVRHLSVVVGTTAFAETHSEGVSLEPVEFFLAQNYPNPFNPETVIRYGLDRQSPVVLAIYNMLGQRIRTLVEAEQTSGRHEVVWDGLDAAGRPAASGLYVYQLRAGAFIASRKMLLLR